MKKLLSLVFACAAAVAALAQPATHPVSIQLAYDGSVCYVAAVQPMTVEADPGDKVEWSASDGSGQCGGRTVRLLNFKLKGSGTPKDPVPGCRKEISVGGEALRCTINNASKGEDFKYDVDLPGGRGMDPEIQIRD